MLLQKHFLPIGEAPAWVPQSESCPPPAQGPQKQRSFSRARGDKPEGEGGGGAGTCGVVAVPLVAPDVLCAVTMGRVEEVDVLVIVAGQELCRGRAGPGSASPSGLPPRLSARSGRSRGPHLLPEPSWL